MVSFWKRRAYASHMRDKVRSARDASVREPAPTISMN